MTTTMSGLNLTFTFGSSVFSAATLVTSERFNVSAEVMVLGTSLYRTFFMGKIAALEETLMNRT